MIAKARRAAVKGPAWRDAVSYGCDMSLIEDNLRRTADERIGSHQRALKTAMLLRRAMEKRRRV